jgi:molecular chaperone HscB
MPLNSAVPSDPFDTLGLPPRFDLPAAEIDRSYLSASGRLHPDLARDDADAGRAMADLNRAKRILGDPERRADALLTRIGGPRREQERGLPPDFLMEMIEVREAVEAAVGQSEPAARQRERAKWEAWAEERRREAIAEVGGMFEALGPSPGPGALHAIRVRLNAWRYIERLIEQLDPDYDPARADFATD